jgi:cytochrome c oxidase assembly protein subunit 11
MNNLLNLYKHFNRVKYIDQIHKNLVINKTFSINSTILRQNSNYSKNYKDASRLNSAPWYATSGLILMLGLTYAAVPLYKIFCEANGIDIKNSSEASDEIIKNRVKNLKRNENRVIKVKFLANRSTDLLWDFEPMQSEINLAIGETSLAFYKAKSLSKRPITGIATYNIIPFEAGLYFNKIQCFCFEEQRLEPGEEVDMPVFFYLDDEFGNDPLLENVDSICLSYTFFESKGSINLENELPKLPKQFLQ